MMLNTFTTAALLSASMLVAAPALAHGPVKRLPGETVSPAFSHPLATVPGKTVTALTVSYAPGAKSVAHRHGKTFVIAYVLEGAIRSKVDDQSARVYQAGESWTEMPGALHSVSENASKTKPARLIAFFTADTGDEDLVTPANLPGDPAPLP